MKLFRRSTRFLAASLALALVLAACGGDDDTVASGNDEGAESSETPGGDSSETAEASGDFCQDLESLATQAFPIMLPLALISMSDDPGDLEVDAESFPAFADQLAELGALAEQVEAEAPDEIAETVTGFTQGIQGLADALAEVDPEDPAAVKAAFDSSGLADASDEEDARVEAFLESECGFTLDQISEDAFSEGVSGDEDEEPVAFDGVIDLADRIERPEGEPAQFTGSPFTCDSLDQEALVEIAAGDIFDTQNIGINPGFSLMPAEDHRFEGTHWGGCEVDFVEEAIGLSELTIEVLEVGDQFEAIKAAVEADQYVTGFGTIDANAFFYEMGGHHNLYVLLDSLVLHVDLWPDDIPDPGVAGVVDIAELALATW